MAKRRTSKLSKAQQKRLSRAISKYYRKGYKHRQAIAIAYSVTGIGRKKRKRR